MSKSTPVLESEKSGMKTQLPASLVAMCCSPAIAILNSESLPLLLNHHTAQVCPAARPAPRDQRGALAAPVGPAASARRRRRLRAPGCGCD